MPARAPGKDVRDQCQPALVPLSGRTTPADLSSQLHIRRRFVAGHRRNRQGSARRRTEPQPAALTICRLSATAAPRGDRHKATPALSEESRSGKGGTRQPETNTRQQNAIATDTQLIARRPNFLLATIPPPLGRPSPRFRNLRPGAGPDPTPQARREFRAVERRTNAVAREDRRTPGAAPGYLASSQRTLASP